MIYGFLICASEGIVAGAADQHSPLLRQRGSYRADAAILAEQPRPAWGNSVAEQTKSEARNGGLPVFTCQPRSR